MDGTYGYPKSFSAPKERRLGLVKAVLACLGALARLRIVQFFALGALIFAVDRHRSTTRQIELSRADLTITLRAERQRHPGRPTSADAVDERAIEDELLYREALRRGFDREDGIVRQRLIQKMLYFAEELAGATQPPTQAELRRYYEQTRERWGAPAEFTIQQVFAQDRAKLERILAQLREAKVDPRGLGDASPMPFEIHLGRDRIADSLGAAFAAALPTSPSAEFTGPIQSAYGWHAVRVLGYVPAHLAPFEAARPRVQEQYLVSRREDAVADYVRRAFAEYRVRIDGVDVRRIEPSHRLALRGESSGED